MGLVLMLTILWTLPTHGQNETDFSGVWIGIGDGSTPGGLRNTLWPDNPPFTSAGAEEFQNTDPAADAVIKRCWPPGAVRTMSAHDTFAIEIIHLPESVTIIPEIHYQVRRIYTDGRDHPDYDTWVLGFGGHSIAVWNGNTLVVDTIYFNDKIWLSQTGLPASEELHLTERLRLIEDRSILENQITIEDPVSYMVPLTLSRYWRRAPDKEIGEPSYSCQENLQLSREF